ncbi:class I SAM-dependent DNA methyltransferase [Amycolatopsis alkalitolerans]|uniref:Class I SAM-dependent methyltransferase n=1 Tax=Amycolatopsis alkalitolerans TaxID=2547244 RepID=A0A5C4LRU7_9PSEU|nr:class I SAM-dependent methyltransferase [Amycolatopsis alkalitolerans]TNC21568.1 class I SAM-dependent methyltransferase [Amycolatopsis alkalitolerans]
MSSFDEKAATWDDEAKTERARVVAAAIRRVVAPTGSTRVLEYGAGTGLVSQQLADGVGPITLADSSAGMRDVMRGKLATGALPANTRIWDLDLSAGSVPGERFDLIVTVMALHHIPDLTPVLDAFASLLDEGGHLCVVDLVKEDGSFHDGGDFHGHHGFDTGDLSARLESAGFADVHVEQVYEVVRDGAAYPLFLAAGTKAR